MSRPISYPLALAAFSLALTACSVGPDYVRPTAPLSAAYSDPGPWKVASPRDTQPRGAWWKAFHDPDLDRLEEQVALSNQNVLAAEATFRAAIATVRVDRAGFFPTITGSPQYTRSATSQTLSNGSGGGGGVTTTSSAGGGSTVVTSGSGGGGGNSATSRGVYNLPIDLQYLVDVWGSVRRTVEADKANAAAALADLQSARLSYQGTLAQNYFALRGSDAQADVLERTLAAYRKTLELTTNRYRSGVASQADVTQAQTQLDLSQAQLIDLGIARAQYEHAIALLIGQPAGSFSLPRHLADRPPPEVPSGLPAELLERRPDISAAERRVAAANARIGVATAAYYPSITLDASSGLQSIALSKLFSGPSIFWSVGPVIAQTIFDAGRTHAQVDFARANYQAEVATYRNTVLTALQQVEDQLAGLRLLALEAKSQRNAVASANKSLEISTNLYKAGTQDYLNVITAQTTALNAELTQTSIATRRSIAAALLIQSLGGGWERPADWDRAGIAPAP